MDNKEKLDDMFLLENFNNLKIKELRNHFKKPYAEISYRAYQLGLITESNRSTKHTIDESVYNSWNEKNAWAFGFIMADGHIKQGRPDRDERVLEFEIAEYDIDILEKFKSIFAYTADVRKSKRNTVKISISNKMILNKLQDLGIPSKNKTENQEWPKSLPDELAPHLIRGIVDGDGSFYKDGSLRFQVLGTKNVLSNITNYLEDEYDNNFIKNRKDYGGANVHVLRLGQRRCLPLLYKMYDGATVYSSRKKDKLLNIVKECTDKESHIQNAGAFLKLRELLESLD